VPLGCENRLSSKQLNLSTFSRRLILRPAPGSLVFITQPDHAILAADLVARFQGLVTHPRREAILLAVREHDNGWRELDDEIVFDDKNGRALDFINVPEPLKQGVWPRGIDRLAPASPHAAALVAEHALFVHEGNRGKPEWSAFFETVERQRASLVAQTGGSRAELADDYRFLALADLLSLSFCHGWRDARERFGHAVRCEGDDVIVSPAVIGGAPIPLDIQGRRVADRRYTSLAELRAALEAAPRERVIGHARDQDAAR
jgi:hypothetical protein